MRYLVLLLTLFHQISFTNTSDIKRLSLDKCLSISEQFVSTEYIQTFERAYVRVSADTIDIVFSKGALGTFEKRSLSYNPMLFCISNRELDVKFLASSMKNVFIDNFNESSPDYKEHKVMEFLYLKNKKGNFMFKNKQILSDDNFEKNNPNLFK